MVKSALALDAQNLYLPALFPSSNRSAGGLSKTFFTGRRNKQPKENKIHRKVAKHGFEPVDNTELQHKNVTKEIDLPLGADSSIDWEVDTTE